MNPFKHPVPTSLISRHTCIGEGSDCNAESYATVSGDQFDPVIGISAGGCPRSSQAV